MPKSKGIAGPCAYNTPREKAVICSNCDETAHRYCVGVSIKEFSAISKSSPYSCARCQREVYQTTISEMQDTIVTLWLEIAELRTALTDLSKRQERHEQSIDNQPHRSSQNSDGGSSSSGTQWANVV